MGKRWNSRWEAPSWAGGKWSELKFMAQPFCMSQGVCGSLQTICDRNDFLFCGCDFLFRDK